MVKRVDQIYDHIGLFNQSVSIADRSIEGVTDAAISPLKEQSDCQSDCEVFLSNF